MNECLNKLINKSIVNGPGIGNMSCQHLTSVKSLEHPTDKNTFLLRPPASELNVDKGLTSSRMFISVKYILQDTQNI